TTTKTADSEGSCSSTPGSTTEARGSERSEVSSSSSGPEKRPTQDRCGSP
ncbi:MAG: hypothetical protein ACI90M_004420, partial [Candidatus Azotimanducaceae bacterium]